MKTQKQILGAWGEDQAVEFLKSEGYEVVDRNYRIRKGELDIIAWQKKKGENTLCFIEVKTRESDDDGTAERATGYAKQSHIFRCAKEYCLEKNIRIETTPICFEQVSVYIKTRDDYQIKHYIIPINS